MTYDDHRPGSVSQPQTAAEWAKYARQLHRRGVATIVGMVDQSIPTDVATAKLQHAQACFLAAAAAAAIAVLPTGPTNCGDPGRTSGC